MRTWEVSVEYAQRVARCDDVGAFLPLTMTVFGRTDRLNFCYFFLGCGFLTPWNALLSAVDYFEGIYPDRDVLRWFSIYCIPTTLLAVLANGIIPTRNKGHFRMSCALIVFVLTLLFLPLMDVLFIEDSQGTDTMLGLLMLCVVVIGVMDGIVEGSFMGLAVYLPAQYYQSYVGGQGFAAVFTVALRALTKAILTDSSNGLRMSAGIFFLSAAGICLACLLVQRYFIIPHPLFLEPLNSDTEAPLIPETLSETKHTLFEQLRNSQYLSVALKLKTALLFLLLFNVVTYTIFPGVISDVHCDALGDWYGVILVAVFAVSDYLGRLTPNTFVSTQVLTVSLTQLSMTSLIPITFVAVQFFSNPYLIASLMSLLGITDGYMNLCCFGMGQKKLEGGRESFVGGNILVLASLMGMSLGSFCSMMWARND